MNASATGVRIALAVSTCDLTCQPVRALHSMFLAVSHMAAGSSRPLCKQQEN
jgi:hypothetical protein